MATSPRRTPPARPLRTSGAPILVGCAGWALPRAWKQEFPAEGSHLARYAARFPCVEINSSFYRPHRPATYARWAETVPPAFRFSVKLPREITHDARLVGARAPLERFLGECTQLGDKLGCLLVQLPPSFELDPRSAARFFRALRERTAVDVVCEPRHPSWFTPAAEALLAEYEVGQVAADPAVVPEAGEPRGHRGVAYYRLHGSPRVYYSAYDEAYLDALAGRLRRDARAERSVWCVFDNTALAHATRNGLDLLGRLSVPAGV